MACCSFQCSCCSMGSGRCSVLTQLMETSTDVSMQGPSSVCGCAPPALKDSMRRRRLWSRYGLALSYTVKRFEDTP